jgi:WD40 repeat protein
VVWTAPDDDVQGWSLAFDQDGARLAVGTLDGAIRLFDVETREQIGGPLTGGHLKDGIQDVAFQPDGNLLASAGWDNTVRLWDLDTRQTVGAPLAEHTDRPVTLSFSPDGTRLASAGWDGTPLVWTVADRTVWAALREPGDMQGIRYLASGELVGTGTNGLIAHWRTDPDGALADVCRRLSPELTPDEWRQFAPDVEYVSQCD